MDVKLPKGWIKCKNSFDGDSYFNIANITAVDPWSTTNATIHFGEHKVGVKATVAEVMTLIANAQH
jgi:hypothetical protein